MQSLLIEKMNIHDKLLNCQFRVNLFFGNREHGLGEHKGRMGKFSFIFIVRLTPTCCFIFFCETLFYETRKPSRNLNNLMLRMLSILQFRLKVSSPVHRLPYYN